MTLKGCRVVKPQHNQSFQSVEGEHHEKAVELLKQAQGNYILILSEAIFSNFLGNIIYHWKSREVSPFKGYHIVPQV